MKIGTRNLSSATLLICICAVWVSAQGQTLTLQNTQNGFTGEYGTGSAKISAEYQVIAADSTISRIKDSANKTIAESVRDKDVVRVKIQDVILTINMDNQNVDNSTSSELSESDRKKIETFRLSAESGNVRKLIIELMKQKVGAEKAQIKGFIVIATLIGDGPGTPAGTQAKSNHTGPKPMWLHTGLEGYSSAKSNKISNFNSKIQACYCCGVGCECFCYTGACVAHDVCVDKHGYTSFRCHGYLIMAIASIYGGKSCVHQRDSTMG